MKFSFTYKKKKIEIEVEYCKNFAVGLMFSKRNSRALLFDFKKSTREAIHSFFVFYPFIAVWLDNKNKVVEIKVVKPFTLSVRPKKPFYRLLEIPISDNYSKEVALIVGN